MLHQQSNDQTQTPKIMMKLKESKQYWNIKNQVLASIMQTMNPRDLQNLSQDDISQVSQQLLLEEQLKQLINNYIQKGVKHDPIRQDPLEYLNQSKLKWTELLYKNFVVVYEMSKREEEDETSNDSKLCLYDDKNLLAFLISVKSVSAATASIIAGLQPQGAIVRMIQVNFRQNSLYTIKEVTKYIRLKKPTNLGTSNDDQSIFNEKLKQARQLIENEVLENEIEKFCQEGVPHGERSELYQKLFEIEGKEANFQQQFKKLEKEINSNTTFLDEIMDLDCREILEDPRYFVFQEQIQTILKAIIRDKSVRDQLYIHPHQFEIPFLNEYGLQLPNCGYLPSKNMAKYIAPFCYFSLKNHIIYALFASFFCRYFCFLHSISSHPSSILSISILFEDIMWTLAKNLMIHLKDISADALKIVFPMMQFVFIGYFDIEQVCYLMDRIIGFQGTEILAFVASGLLISKKAQLIQAKSQQDVEMILGDLSDESAIDLLLVTFNQI